MRFCSFGVGSSPTTGTKTKSLAPQGIFHFLFAHQCFFHPLFCVFCMPTHTFVCPFKLLMQNENAKRECKMTPALY